MALAFAGASAGPRRRSSNSGLADALVGTQACSFAGRTVLTVMHESTRVPSFPAITPPETPRISCPQRADSRFLLVIGS
jgi:hypothetical protein